MDHAESPVSDSDFDLMFHTPPISPPLTPPQTPELQTPPATPERKLSTNEIRACHETSSQRVHENVFPAKHDALNWLEFSKRQRSKSFSYDDMAPQIEVSSRVNLKSFGKSNLSLGGPPISFSDAYNRASPDLGDNDSSTSMDVDFRIGSNLKSKTCIDTGNNANASKASDALRSAFSHLGPTIQGIEGSKNAAPVGGIFPLLQRNQSMENRTQEEKRKKSFTGSTVSLTTLTRIPPLSSFSSTSSKSKDQYESAESLPPLNPMLVSRTSLNRLSDSRAKLQEDVPHPKPLARSISQEQTGSSDEEEFENEIQFADAFLDEITQPDNKENDSNGAPLSSSLIDRTVVEATNLEELSSTCAEHDGSKTDPTKESVLVAEAETFAEIRHRPSIGHEKVTLSSKLLHFDFQANGKEDTEDDCNESNGVGNDYVEPSGMSAISEEDSSLTESDAKRLNSKTTFQEHGEGGAVQLPTESNGELVAGEKKENTDGQRTEEVRCEEIRNEESRSSERALRNSRSSFASDEGCYSARSSSILKSSSVLSDIVACRRGSWSNGVGQVGSSSTHRSSSGLPPRAPNFVSRYSTPPRTSFKNFSPSYAGSGSSGTGSNFTPVFKPSLVSLRTYYACGAKSMPTVNRWVRTQTYHCNNLSGYGFERSHSASGSNWRIKRVSSYESSTRFKSYDDSSVSNYSKHSYSSCRVRGGSDPSVDDYPRTRRPKSEADSTTSAETTASGPPVTFKESEKLPVEKQKPEHIVQKINIQEKQEMVNMGQWMVEKVSRLSLSVTPSLILLNASVASLLQSMKNEVATLRANLLTAQNRMKELENEKALVIKQNDHTRRQMKGKVDEVFELKAKNDTLQLENEILKKKLEESQMFMFEEPRIRAMEQHIEYLQGIINQKEEAEQILMDQLHSLQDRSFGINVVINQEPSASSWTGVNDLTGELDSANAEINHLNTLRQKLEGDMASLQTEMEMALNELKNDK